jgi:hypothetical protein
MATGPPTQAKEPIMITIESDTGYNFQGNIIRRREADGLILALAESNGIYTVYLCREYTKTVGRKHGQHYKWLSFRDRAPSFRSRDEAMAYAMEV